MLVKASVEPAASVAVQAVSVLADLVLPLVSLDWVVPVATVPRAMPSVALRGSFSGITLIPTTPSARSATRAKATRSRLTKHDTRGEPATIEMPRNPLITSGATTPANITFNSNQL